MLKPLHKNVVLKKVEEEKKTASGIILTQAPEKKPSLGEVVAVSENTLLIGSNISAAIGEDGKDVVSGTIQDIVLKDDKVFVKIDGVEKDVELEDISSLVSSLSLVGQEITAGDISGKVDGVIIRDKKVYLQVGDKEVSYKDIK